MANIKKLIVQGTLSQIEIGKKYGVSRSIISDIDSGRAWKEIEWPEGYKPKLSGPQRKRVPEYDPTDGRIIELETEVEALRAERQHARDQYRASRRELGLFRAVVEEMEERVKPIKPFANLKPHGLRKKGLIHETLVMHLSDGHHDQTVRSDECGGLEEYDFPTSVRRAERYVQKLIDYTQGTLGKTYHFPELWILAYGDHTSGEIHNAVQRSYFRNQFKNSFGIGQLHGCMIAELAPYFQTINVVYVPGNHGRRSHKKDYHGAHDNWDFVVGKVAEAYCKEHDNVNFAIPDSFCANLNIADVGVQIFHGDDVHGAMGIPWYGLERRTRRVASLHQAAGLPRIRYQVCGHFHKPAMIGDLDGELLINGPWLATDAYAYNKFNGYTEPSQWLHGINAEDGITWRMAVHLRNRTKYRETPSRYRIDGLGEIE